MSKKIPLPIVGTGGGGGFDEAGEQVWGSTAGGYVFDRVAR